MSSWHYERGVAFARSAQEDPEQSFSSGAFFSPSDAMQALAHSEERCSSEDEQERVRYQKNAEFWRGYLSVWD